MFSIVVACEGVPPEAAPQAALEIVEEFKHRPWHQNVACVWDGRALVLNAVNDYDTNGLALLDEFSDALAACITELFDGKMYVVSATEVPE